MAAVFRSRAQILRAQVANVVVTGKHRENLDLFHAGVDKVGEPPAPLLRVQPLPQLRVLRRDPIRALALVAGHAGPAAECDLGRAAKADRIRAHRQRLEGIQPTADPPSAQAPRQFTVSSVTLRSRVVSPAWMQSFFSIRSRICGAPRTWQAVPMQTRTRCLPRGLRLKAL